MIEVQAAGNSGMMAGILDKLGQGGAGRVSLYSSARPDTSTLVATVYMAEPAGTLQINGDLLLVPGVQSVVVHASVPVWGQVLNGAGEALFKCDVRLSGAADTGQELVIAATGVVVGALVQIQSGTFSTLP